MFNIPRAEIQPGFSLQPGQHVFVCSMDEKGDIIKRPYTPISHDANHMELLVKVYPKGVISKYIHGLSVGDSISVLGPVGDFKFQKDRFNHWVMFAAGTGITPMLQIVRALFPLPHSPNASSKHLSSQSSSSSLNSNSNSHQNASDSKSALPTVTLFFSNRSERDILLEPELRALAQQHPDRFVVHHVLSQPSSKFELNTRSRSGSDSADTPHLSGRINAHMVRTSLKPAVLNACKSSSSTHKQASPIRDSKSYEGKKSPQTSTRSSLSNASAGPDSDAAQILVCGPDSYSMHVFKMLTDELGVPGDSIFIFT
jgi:ferredoxin-NADP reductase